MTKHGHVIIAASTAALALALAACGATEQDHAGEREGAPPAPTVVASTSSAAARHIADTASRTLVVYKSPSCGCCADWVDHMKENGFTVEVRDTADVTPVKREAGIAQELHSCHTAFIGGYSLEGHVPAGDVKRMLRERPSVAGLTVPGMPMGSPGMEGPVKQRYDVVAFDRSGRTSVFASH